MARTTPSPHRRRALALLGTTIAGCTLFSGLGLDQVQAQAQERTSLGDPYIFLVDEQRAAGQEDGLALFGAWQRDVNVYVVNDDDARLEILDEEHHVLCTREHGQGPCTVELDPGRHVLSAEVTRDGGTKTSEPVVVLSDAPERDPQETFDGVAPAAVSVVDAVADPTNPLLTQATLAGQPGDVVMTLSGGLMRRAGVFDASGRLSVDVGTGASDTDLVVETRRDGQRLRTTVVVPGKGQEAVVATPVELVSATRTGAFTGEIVVRATPYSQISLWLGHQAPRRAQVDQSGLFTWQVALTPEAYEGDVETQAIGDQGIEHSSFHVSFPRSEEGAPIVADRPEGDVDPGFTVPGEDDSAAGVPLRGVLEGEKAGVTRLVYGGTPGDFLVATDRQRFTAYGTVTADGVAVLDVPDFLVGETRQITVDNTSTGASSTHTVEGKGRAPVATSPLELVEVLPSDTATAQVVLRGTPGDRYQVFQGGAQHDGVVPEDGLVRVDLDFQGPQTWITAVAIGDSGPVEQRLLVTAPGVPAEGEVTLASVTAGPEAGQTVATFHSRANSQGRLLAAGGRPLANLFFDDEGNASYTFADLAEGQSSDVVVSVFTSTGPRDTSFTIDGAGARPVAAQALELVEVQASDTARARVVLRGLPGQAYRLALTELGVETEGIVPEDGLVRWDVDFPADTVELFAETRGDKGTVEHALITVTALPGTEPPATPGGQADPGFGAPSKPGFGSLEVELGLLSGPSGGSKTARMRLQDPAAERDYRVAVRVDGKFRTSATVGKDTSFVTVPAVGTSGDHEITFDVDGAVVASYTVSLGDPAAPAPVAATETPEDVAPGFTAPEQPADTEQPGDGEQPAEPAQGETLELELGFTSPSYGGSQTVALSDPRADRFGYRAQVRLDGKTVDSVWVTDRRNAYAVKGVPAGSGEHTVEFVVGDVVKSLTFTV